MAMYHYTVFGVVNLKMKYLILLLLVGACYAETQQQATADEGINICPDVIYYNISFWQAHFGMQFDEKLGVYAKKEYESEETTTDLPDMFPEGAARPFAQHYYVAMGLNDIMWFSTYRSDRIIHWYQGAAAVFSIIHPTTGVIERKTVNARNVVIVIEAGYRAAASVRAAGKNQYVLLGQTMAPGVIDEDVEMATPRDVTSKSKIIRRHIKPLPAAEA